MYKIHGRRLGCLLLLLVFLWMFLPFVFALVPTDHDALAQVSHIRNTGRFYSWTDGFYFNSLLTGAANAGLGFFGLARDDYFLAYRAVVTAAYMAGALLAGLITLLGTGSRAAGLAVACFLALMPGGITLLREGEDNVITAFMNLQYLAVFLMGARFSRGPQAPRLWPAWYFPVLAASLFLAVNAHHTLNILWVTPLFFPWFARSLPRRRAWLGVLSVYALAGACFCGLYLFLTWKWLGQVSWGGLLQTIEGWVIPNEFYRYWYFWNRFGWDIPRQISSIFLGAGKIMSRHPHHAALLWLPYLLVPALAVKVMGWQRLKKDWQVQALSLLAFVHVPHSLVYDSHSLERWDVLMGPLAIIMGYLAFRVAKVLKEGGGNRTTWMAAILGASIISGLFAYNVKNYAEIRQSLAGWAGREDVAVLTSKLKRNYGASPPRVYILFKGEEGYAMLVNTYFPFGSRVFAVDSAGKVYKSGAIYPVYEEIPWEEFSSLVRGRRLVFDQKVPGALAESVDSAVAGGGRPDE